MSEPAIVEAVVLVGHGAAASDTPRALVSRLKQLEGERRARGAPMSEEESSLDRQVRACMGPPGRRDVVGVLPRRAERPSKMYECPGARRGKGSFPRCIPATLSPCPIPPQF